MPGAIIIGQGGGSGGGSGSNLSVGLTGTTAPTSATELGIIISGVFRPVSDTYPLPVDGTITATNPSVGVIGSTAPLSATFLGVVNGSGNLEGVGASNPVRIDPTGTTIQPVEVSDGTNVVFTSAHPAYVQEPTLDGCISAGKLTVTGTIAATQSGTWTVGISAAQTIAVTNAGTFAVQATLAAETTKVIGTVNQGTSPWVISGAVTTSGTVTAIGTLTNNNAAPSTNNIGALVALANAAAPTNTEGDQTLLSVDLAGNIRATLHAETTKVIGTVNQGTSPWVISGAVTTSGTVTAIGTLTNNNAAPSTTNVGVLPAIANAAAPTYTEGDQVLASVDLAGSLRTNTAEWGGTVVSAPTAASTPPAGTEVAPVIRPIGRKQTQILTTTALAGNAVFTSSWFDTNATGDAWASAFAYTSAAANSATNGFIIQGTDDQSNASLTKTLSFASVVGNNQSQITAFISTRYWRVQYTNGSTTQVGSSFEVTATSVNYANNLFIQSPPNPGAISQAVWTTSIAPNALNPTVTDGRVAFQQTDVNNTVAGIPASLNMVSTGTAAGFFQRTPAIFKTAQFSASGLTPVWTPVSGKKFRLMKFQILLTDNASTVTTPAVVTASLFDAGTITSSTFTTFSITSNVLTINGTFSGFAAGQNVLLTGFTATYLNNISLTLTTASASVLTATFTHANVGSTGDTTGTATAGYIMSVDFYLPATAIAAPIGDGFQSGWIDLGNGFISATANNPLAVSLNLPISTGVGRIVMCGTEE